MFGEGLMHENAKTCDFPFSHHFAIANVLVFHFRNAQYLKYLYSRDVYMKFWRIVHYLHKTIIIFESMKIMAA